jgi:hypothetical protein
MHIQPKEDSLKELLDLASDFMDQSKLYNLPGHAENNSDLYL